MPRKNRRDPAEREVQRIQDLRRGNTAQPIPSGKKYDRKRAWHPPMEWDYEEA